MTIGPSLDLQGAIATTLCADNELAALFGGKVRLYQDVPANPSFPYITIGEGHLVPDVSDCIDGAEIYPVLHIWSRASGFEEAKKIAATGWTALRDATFNMTETRCVLFERDQLGDQELRDPDGVTKHIACHYRALCEPQ